MKTCDGTIWFKRCLILCTLIILIIGGYTLRCNIIYNSISVKVSKNTKVEYGSANYKVEDFLDEVSGDKVNVLKDVNPNVYGEQEIILEVSKENIKKEIPITVEVVDSVAPEIKIKNEVIYVNVGSYYDLKKNVESVTDVVDGELVYVSNSKIKESNKNYYTISDVNFNTCGTKDVEIKAVDKYGNVSTKSFQVKVISNGKEQTLSNVAYSLLGSPYVYGGTSPSGFDCSGFVQYVYARAGIKVSRSASTQLYDGYEVSYSNIRVGDIIVWGYGRDSVTHTAIYVGNGLMIHAATPKDGVIINKVSGWGNYSGVHIVSVRRVK